MQSTKWQDLELWQKLHTYVHEAHPKFRELSWPRPTLKSTPVTATSMETCWVDPEGARHASDPVLKVEDPTLRLTVSGPNKYRHSALRKDENAPLAKIVLEVATHVWKLPQGQRVMFLHCKLNDSSRLLSQKLRSNESWWFPREPMGFFQTGYLRWAVIDHNFLLESNSAWLNTRSETNASYFK